MFPIASVNCAAPQTGEPRVRNVGTSTIRHATGMNQRHSKRERVTGKMPSSGSEPGQETSQQPKPSESGYPNDDYHDAVDSPVVDDPADEVAPQDPQERRS